MSGFLTILVILVIAGIAYTLAIWIIVRAFRSSRVSVYNGPVPGKDATWCALCDHCVDFALFASRGGYRNGGIEHCYTCGHERITNGVKESDIGQMITSAWSHWQKYPLIPYNWHELSENKKLEILGMGNKERE